jgi:hypothetical protein
MRCPVCGAERGACGDQPLVFAPLDVAPPRPRGAEMAVSKNDRPRMPRQYMPPGRGEAGYNGNVEVYDPTTEGIPEVDDVDENTANADKATPTDAEETAETEATTEETKARSGPTENKARTAKQTK